MAVPLPPEYGAGLTVPLPPAASSRDGQPGAAVTVTGSLNWTWMCTESPAKRTALAFEADTPATAGRMPSTAMDAECDSDPGAPGSGRARMAALPARSAMPPYRACVPA